MLDQGSPAFEVNEDCAVVGNLLARIGDKWSVLVIAVLDDRVLRFSQLRRRVGAISQKMLTTTLRGLERDGFVTRTIYPTIPPKVEYELTELGLDLLGPVKTLGTWAKSHKLEVQQARERYDTKKQSA